MRFILVSILNGFLFGMMDGLINGNPFARKLFSVFQPIAKTTINVPAGIVIDLIYGFVMSWLFLMLYQSLPGSTGIVKGISFGLIMWFFRVVMYVATTWMMFKVPVSALFYSLITGLVEMVVLGVLYGLLLKK